MILASKEMISENTAKGFWNDATLNQIFKDFAEKNPERLFKYRS